MIDHRAMIRSHFQLDYCASAPLADDARPEERQAQAILREVLRTRPPCRAHRSSTNTSTSTSTTSTSCRDSSTGLGGASSGLDDVPLLLHVRPLGVGIGLETDDGDDDDWRPYQEDEEGGRSGSGERRRGRRGARSGHWSTWTSVVAYGIHPSTGMWSETEINVV